MTTSIIWPLCRPSIIIGSIFLVLCVTTGSSFTSNLRVAWETLGELTALSTFLASCAAI